MSLVKVGENVIKDFTRAERGKVRLVYCRRNVFWDIIVELVTAGDTSDTAVN